MLPRPVMFETSSIPALALPLPYYVYNPSRSSAAVRQALSYLYKTVVLLLFLYRSLKLLDSWT